MLVRIDDFPRYIKIISAPDVLVPSDCPNEARLEYLKSQQVQHAHGLNIVQATPGLLHFLKQHNIPYALGNTRKQIGRGLNPEYVSMSERRIISDAPLFKVNP
jgi:hypothetical protein